MPRAGAFDQASPDDARWIVCRRPLVTVGGELTLEQMQLNPSPAGFYRAPLQAIANGGVLVIDDFGRQRCSPSELLNRWIVPLESRVDYLSLETGQMFELPFAALVVFATNLRPSELVDEAFLRRIHAKVCADRADAEEFAQIFESCCEARDLGYDPALVDAPLRQLLPAPAGSAARLPSARPHRPRALARPSTAASPGSSRRSCSIMPARCTSSTTARWRRPFSDMSLSSAVLALIATVLSVPVAAAHVAADAAAPTVRITSPLGRTGGVGAIRIVAQVAGAESPVQAVRFFVNSKPVGEDHVGPVYAVEWTDENPFERTEIAAEVVDADGRAARGRRRAAGVRVRRGGAGVERAARGHRAGPSGPVHRWPGAGGVLAERERRASEARRRPARDDARHLRAGGRLQPESLASGASSCVMRPGGSPASSGRRIACSSSRSRNAWGR